MSGARRPGAEALVETFRALGAGDPEAWAESEVEDDIPQLARFLFLRRLWRSAWQWKLPPEQWFAEMEPEPAGGDEVEEDDDTPTLVSDAYDADEDDDTPTLVSDAYDADEDDADGDPPFLAAEQAVRRILAAGADPEDLRQVARAIFLHTAYDAVQTVDEGHDPQAGEGMPGWLLTEVGGDLVLTGRVIPDLHEDLLTTEPDESEAEEA